MRHGGYFEKWLIRILFNPSKEGISKFSFYTLHLDNLKNREVGITTEIHKSLLCAPSRDSTNVIIYLMQDKYCLIWNS